MKVVEYKLYYRDASYSDFYDVSPSSTILIIMTIINIARVSFSKS